jgi:hypothetical protein
VYLDISASPPRREISCAVGMATAAALFRLKADEPLSLKVAVFAGAGLHGDVESYLESCR